MVVETNNKNLGTLKLYNPIEGEIKEQYSDLYYTVQVLYCSTILLYPQLSCLFHWAWATLGSLHSMNMDQTSTNELLPCFGAFIRMDNWC